MPDPLTDAEYALLARFRYALRAFTAFSEGQAADCGLTPQQHQALLAIRGAPAASATVGLVAERLILKPHSASGLVDRLEVLGLVTREASPRDRRQALLVLTPRAHDLLARLGRVHREEILRIRPTLIALLDQMAP